MQVHNSPQKQSPVNFGGVRGPSWLRRGCSDGHGCLNVVHIPCQPGDLSVSIRTVPIYVFFLPRDARSSNADSGPAGPSVRRISFRVSGSLCHPVPLSPCRPVPPSLFSLHPIPRLVGRTSPLFRRPFGAFCGITLRTPNALTGTYIRLYVCDT